MVAAILLTLVVVLLIGAFAGFTAGLGRALWLGLKAFWQYKLVCIPISAVLVAPLILLALAPNLPAAPFITLAIVVIGFVGLSAAGIASRRSKRAS